MTKYLLSFSLILCVHLAVLSSPYQPYVDNSGTVDSLWSLINSGQIKQIQARDILDIANDYFQTAPDLSNALGELAIHSQFAEENILFKSRAYLEVGYNLNKQGNIDKALEYLDTGLSLAKSNQDRSLEMYGLNCLGIYHNDRGDNVSATQYYIESMSIAQEIKDTLGMIKPHVNLTGIFLEQNRPEKSIEYGLNGIRLSKAFKELRGEGFLSNNIAQAFIQQDNPKAALPYLLRALEISSGRKDKETMARNHSNLCSAYRLIGEMAKADFHCEYADELLEPLNNPRSKMMHAVTKGKYLLDANRLSQAILEAQKAKNLGEEASLSIHMASVYELLYQIYKKEGRLDLALKMYEKHWEIKYGSFSAKNNAQISATEASYTKLVEQNEKLVKEAEVITLENQSKSSIQQRNWALGLAALTALLGGFIYSQYRDKNRTNEILRTQKSEIEEQQLVINKSLQEKELLLKEIHHRVKNNLQIISSLLNLQSKKITDESVLASITEGKNRVEAMSLIHQNLYQSDDIATINMHDYILQLMHNLSGSFDFPARHISYKVDAGDVNFDIDTAIPVGLIVNELVTNSAKHAFGENGGEIVLIIHKTDSGKYRLSVSDNGKGIPKEVDLLKSKSLGFKLVKTLGVKQLKGVLTVERDKGTLIRIEFDTLNV